MFNLTASNERDRLISIKGMFSQTDQETLLTQYEYAERILMNERKANGKHPSQPESTSDNQEITTERTVTERL